MYTKNIPWFPFTADEHFHFVHHFLGLQRRKKKKSYFYNNASIIVQFTTANTCTEKFQVIKI